MQNDRLMNTFGDALKQLLQRHQPRIQPVQPFSNLLNSVFHGPSLWNLFQLYILLALHFFYLLTILLLKSPLTHTHIIDSRLPHPDTPPHAPHPPHEFIIRCTGILHIHPLHLEVLLARRGSKRKGTSFGVEQCPAEETE